MDYQKKKLLTQSVAFLQAHLTLTSNLLDVLKDNGVLTYEEATVIQKDDTSSGKVLELVCLLKRKDNRSYTRFLQTLEATGCSAVANMLKTKATTSGEALLPDPRTMQFLEKQLGGSQVTAHAIKDLALRVVLKEIHQDETTALQDKLNKLQRVLKSRAEIRVSPDTARPSSSKSTRALSMLSERSLTFDLLPTPKNDDLQDLLSQKDDIIRRRDEEYHKLRLILTDTQNDLQNVLDLNSQYLSIISTYNNMQLNVHSTPRNGVNSEEYAELEKKLGDARRKIEELNHDLDDVSTKVESQQAEIEKMNQREKKYKDMLDLPEDADGPAIEKRIQELMQDGTMSKAQLDKIRKDLFKTQQIKENLEEKLGNLTRDKDKIEFHLRQQNMTIKKMQRQKAAKETLSAAQNALGTTEQAPTQMKLPSIERPGSQLGLAAKSRGSQQYCIFCRQEYLPLKAHACRIHFRPIRGGRWTCCRDDCHHSAGCLQVPHFYIEITVDRKIFITDGARYMELT